jgi:hypothetical protein
VLYSVIQFMGSSGKAAEGGLCRREGGKRGRCERISYKRFPAAVLVSS